ncbi:hypothetical protein EDD17DRAFT_1497422 [Pisolithus thermaeus]|nr:hypothetical protein EDD17DRAFT_1497422 [Pisolithus thermaeus]
MTTELPNCHGFGLLIFPGTQVQRVGSQNVSNALIHLYNSFDHTSAKVYRIHWLRAKAGKDRWEEEESLLTSEFQWVINYF